MILAKKHDRQKCYENHRLMSYGAVKFSKVAGGETSVSESVWFRITITRSNDVCICNVCVCVGGGGVEIQWVIAVG
jgi:hypothetical protein